MPRIRGAYAADPASAEEPSGPEREAGPLAHAPAAESVSGAARSGSTVPMWRPALTADVLAVDYRRILFALAEHHSDWGRVMTCQEITVVLGLELCPAGVEGVQSKMKRLAARGPRLGDGAGPGPVHARRRASLRLMSIVIDHSSIRSWTAGSVS
ncbi:hypothetical protein ABIA33_006628 [Streptacidiphilus sp. MAP12-16]